MKLKIIKLIITIGFELDIISTKEKLKRLKS